MLKRTLALVLAVVLVGTAGCAELKQLREKNAMLESELDSITAERDELYDTVQTLTSARDDAGIKLADARKETDRMAGLLGQLQVEKDKLQRQASELNSLLGNFRGILVEARGDGNVIVMENAILFSPGKSELSKEAEASLNVVADYLGAHATIPVRIDGHTDGQPIKVSGWDDNYHLGAMRANMVRRYLEKHGVSADRMTIVSYGPNVPVVAPPEPAAPMAENRRVEIVLVPEGLRSITDILKDFGD